MSEEIEFDLVKRDRDPANPSKGYEEVWWCHQGRKSICYGKEGWDLATTQRFAYKVLKENAAICRDAEANPIPTNDFSFLNNL